MSPWRLSRESWCRVPSPSLALNHNKRHPDCTSDYEQLNLHNEPKIWRTHLHNEPKYGALISVMLHNEPEYEEFTLYKESKYGKLILHNELKKWSIHFRAKRLTHFTEYTTNENK